ncbi:MAG: hypothetical protein WCZ89_05910 [Phycisphaerae bacterium]
MKKITLDEWIRLSSEQRDEIKEKWKENWNEWCYLLDEAIESFKDKYGEIQEISDVNPAYGCESVTPSYAVSRLTTEPWISVTTSLKENEFIKELPPEYAHFKVVQEPFGSIGRKYLKEWVIALKNLLGWSEEKTISWAEEHHSDDLAGENEWFDHEFPCHYITELLVPKDKLILLGGLERVKFLEKIEVAIYAHNPSPLSENYDWVATRKRVNDVLKGIDASLPV